VCIGQGARLPTRLYSRQAGSVQLRRTRTGWALTGWAVGRRRADKAPADLVPGLLATTIETRGGRVAYVGIGGRPMLGAIAAADERGRLDASVGSAASLGRRALRSWRRAQLVVADLPPG